MPLVSLGGSWCFVLLSDAIVGIYLQLHRWRDGARTREIEVRSWLENPEQSRQESRPDWLLAIPH